MDATRDISQKCEYLDVVTTALRAAHSVIHAEKYTLGILNDKKDAIELLSNPPVAIPGRDYMEEGTIPVDSTTTFGRVVLVRSGCTRCDHVLCSSAPSTAATGTDGLTECDG